MNIVDHFMQPEVRPFAVAAMMIVLVGGVEVGSMLIGLSISELLGQTVDLGHDGNGGSISHVLSWINVGGVPLMICILLALGIFSMLGFLIQDVARLIAAALPPSAAGVLAAIVTVPLLRSSTRYAARLIPQDESYAVGLSDLVGRTGEVAVGPLDQGLPGRVRVRDIHGNWHTVTASAAPDSPPLPEGASVLLVDRKGGRFVAIAAADELTPSQPDRLSRK
ncbi:YqiJ family protein [Bradyrhizobium ontarionense]|uniref:YqiJ family protein n=1 Tax=Bradyrhizobium ontarionense TaxID=2898149 RepID=A0ABY3R5Q9_9BRAD|nr:OB-fold-containig protein [Bradyrhizobium sp. A19]UFZ02382.1 YqiJ family protein [Bradyrhizobium sp. A19]